MDQDTYIGVVTEAEAGKLVVTLDPSLSFLTKKIGGKDIQVGQVGSYITVPYLDYTVVAVVTQCRRFELGDGAPQYLLSVTLIGAVKGGRYDRGVAFIPPVNSPVYIASDEELTTIFSTFRTYDYSIGSLSLFENERAYLHPNRFFNKHNTVLGSSGSGKSCSVASILQKVVAFPNTKVVILDLHNEYTAAFGEKVHALDVAGFELPYWLLNFEEMQEMFIDERDEHASSQISVLKDLVVMSKKNFNADIEKVITIDTPVYFDLNEVRVKMKAMDIERKSGAGKETAEGPFYGKFTRFLVRLDSKFNDPRYNFMFRPKTYTSSETFADLLSKLFGTEAGSNITILNLSGVPFDIVNTIVSLLARLAFDFNFWNPKRSEFPMLLVFEEAHNYLPSTGEGSNAARHTVERIAKEGRKYGISCMIVSQRPSDVSETILSQCSNFVIHRLTNPLDQNYVSRLVPDMFSEFLAALTSLAQGEAFVIGDAVPMPLRVQVDLPSPEPDSKDIAFFDKWKSAADRVPVKDIADLWRKQVRE